MPTSILVVAADESRRRLADILSKSGYSVAEADSGDSALNIGRTISPELILMAIVMPDMNGLVVAARLRRNLSSKSPPIILLGSVPPIGLNEEPLSSLVNGYLNIDVSPDDLLATVRSLLPNKDPILAR